VFLNNFIHHRIIGFSVNTNLEKSCITLLVPLFYTFYLFSFSKIFLYFRDNEFWFDLIKLCQEAQYFGERKWIRERRLLKLLRSHSLPSKASFQLTIEVRSDASWRPFQRNVYILEAKCSAFRSANRNPTCWKMSKLIQSLVGVSSTPVLSCERSGPLYLLFLFSVFSSLFFRLIQLESACQPGPSVFPLPALLTKQAKVYLRHYWMKVPSILFPTFISILRVWHRIKIGRLQFLHHFNISSTVYLEVIGLSSSYNFSMTMKLYHWLYH